MYITRNKNGLLWLHENKPVRTKLSWESVGWKVFIPASTKLFSNIDWNDEPIEVTLIRIDR